MSVTAVARRYGEALADVALAQSKVEEIENEVAIFAQMMKESRELYDVFASPAVSQEDKGKVLDALIERVKPSRWTANLLKTMLRHYRLHLIGAVLEKFRNEINRRRGIVIAEVTTAAPAGDQEREVLARRLQELTGKQVDLRFNADPDLIGGVVARIGSIVYDGSIRTQLQSVKQKLKQDNATTR
jgi:F-type H+-transporting ATPase subunit delta